MVNGEKVPHETELKCQQGDVVRVGAVFTASGSFGHAVYFAKDHEVFGEFTVLLEPTARLHPLEEPFIPTALIYSNTVEKKWGEGGKGEATVDGRN